MAQKKKKFTKDQVAHKLGIQAYIMDAWEKQFEIEPLTKNGAKVYTRKNLAQFRSIKELLYEKGLALDAAKKYFKDHTKLEGTTLLAASPLNFEAQHKPSEPIVQSASPKKDTIQLGQVRDKLASVRERLLKISNSL